MQARTSHCGVEARAAARTNLFLAATVHSAGIGRPVKIRDLSTTGARIEVSPVPEAGAAVTLVRGPLSVQARVSWRAERFCGLSFASPMSIQDWMRNPVILDRRRGDPRIAAPSDVPGAAAAHSETGTGRIAEEITRLLGTLGETLAGDPGVVFKYGTELYNLGLAARRLAALAETMRADKPF